MRVYCIKAALMYNKRTYRNIEILENQTLEDLHSAIFEAFDRYDPHLYSFFLTRKAERSLRKIYEATEITHPMSMESQMGFFRSKKKYDAEKTKIGDLDLDGVPEIGVGSIRRTPSGPSGRFAATLPWSGSATLGPVP